MYPEIITVAISVGTVLVALGIFIGTTRGMKESFDKLEASFTRFDEKQAVIVASIDSELKNHDGRISTIEGRLEEKERHQ